MDDNSGAAALGLLIGMVIGAFVCASVQSVIFNDTYRAGQIDALENRWMYQKAIDANGGVKYLDLGKPTSQPSMVK